MPATESTPARIKSKRARARAIERERREKVKNSNVIWYFMLFSIFYLRLKILCSINWPSPSVLEFIFISNYNVLSCGCWLFPDEFLFSLFFCCCCYCVCVCVAKMDIHHLRHWQPSSPFHPSYNIAKIMCIIFIINLRGVKSECHKKKKSQPPYASSSSTEAARTYIDDFDICPSHLYYVIK